MVVLVVGVFVTWGREIEAKLEDETHSFTYGINVLTEKNYW